MKHNEKGFSVVEVLLLLVVIGLIGGVGWYVLKQRNAPVSKVSPSTKSPSESQDIKLPGQWKVISDPKITMYIRTSDGNTGGQVKAITYTIPDSMRGKLAYDDDSQPGYVPGITRIEYLTDKACEGEWSDSDRDTAYKYYGPGLRVYEYEGDYKFKTDTTDLNAQYAAGKVNDGNYFMHGSGRMYKIGDIFYGMGYSGGSISGPPNPHTKSTTCYYKYESQALSDKDIFQQIANSIQ